MGVWCVCCAVAVVEWWRSSGWRRDEGEVEMRVRVLERKERFVKLEVAGEDHTFLVPLVERLNKDRRVEFANYEKRHPILSEPVLYVKIQEGDAFEVLKDAASSLNEDYEAFERKYRMS